MGSEKIYYAVVILICAASMLLSPFFYLRRSERGVKLQRAPRRWTPIVVANLVMIAAAVFVWWRWF
ncbi:hypothetical protein L4G92_05165 [Neisseria sp. ZJ106]|uniref:Amino acid permease n=1 Tax=Neisseria lisongii TaxID=2912188 RepID=A0ABY7RMJ4_9NEIS|nr:hypothetical protein [Neisseria lisongii]MCF7521439.1 hypothetical protein [Neisseria lisongii]WCL72310.1 hypothetical protein PJU73_04205 [Neisseria lisongii]